MGAVTIEDGVYMIGGPEVTLPEDYSLYLLDLGDLVLIDCGTGRSYSMLVDNIRSLGLNSGRLHTLVLTHCHIDHIGAAQHFRGDCGCRIAAHMLDARAIEQGDISRTEAGLYGIPFSPTPLDQILEGIEMRFNFQRGSLHGLHTPGHTPGFISLYIEIEDCASSLARISMGPSWRDLARISTGGAFLWRSCSSWMRIYSARATLVSIEQRKRSESTSWIISDVCGIGCLLCWCGVIG
jgi:glyoxylase-like metal-dependent hydrolase (beta-lactamase superfamily II)